MSEASQSHAEESVLPTLEELSQGPSPQCRTYSEKNIFISKPKGPVLRLLPVWADSAHSQLEGARIISCPPIPCLPSRPKVPLTSLIASALWMTPGPGNSCCWPPHAGNHALCCLTAVRGAVACPGECLQREQALNWFSRLTVIPSWEAACTGTEQSS